LAGNARKGRELRCRKELPGSVCGKISWRRMESQGRLGNLEGSKPLAPRSRFATRGARIHKLPTPEGVAAGVRFDPCRGRFACWAWKPVVSSLALLNRRLMADIPPGMTGVRPRPFARRERSADAGPRSGYAANARTARKCRCRKELPHAEGLVFSVAPDSIVDRQRPSP
jgi:hypothetical protein